MKTISPSSQAENGDTVCVRNYNSRRKWIADVVTDATGYCIYEILVGDKIFRRHVDQILNNHTKTESTDIDDGEFMSYDFADDYIPRPELGPPQDDSSNEKNTQNVHKTN